MTHARRHPPRRARAGGAAPRRDARPLRRGRRSSCARSSRAPGRPARRASTPSTAPTSSETAERALDQARERLPEDIPATFAAGHARSAPAGLLELAEQHEASLIVLGSSSGGAFGHVSLGSVTDRLRTAPRSPSCSRRAGSAPGRARASRGSRRPSPRPTGPTTSSSRPPASPRGSARRCGSRRSPSGRGRRTRAASGARPPARSSRSGSGRSRRPRGRRSTGRAPAGRAAERDVRDRPRRELGGGARGRRVGGGRRARRRLQLGRPDRARLPRLALVEDRPPLAGAGRGRPARRRRPSCAEQARSGSGARGCLAESSSARSGAARHRLRSGSYVRLSAMPVSASRMTRSATSAE